MKRASIIAAAVGFSLALAACGGKGDDKLGEQVQEAAENKADKMQATPRKKPLTTLTLTLKRLPQLSGPRL